MIVSSAKYYKLQAEFDLLMADYNDLVKKSHTLADRYITLRNVIVNHFGDEILKPLKQDRIDIKTNDGNVITLNRWKNGKI